MQKLLQPTDNRIELATRVWPGPASPGTNSLLVGASLYVQRLHRITVNGDYNGAVVKRKMGAHNAWMLASIQPRSRRALNFPLRPPAASNTWWYRSPVWQFPQPYH